MRKLKRTILRYFVHSNSYGTNTPSSKTFSALQRDTLTLLLLLSHLLHPPPTPPLATTNFSFALVYCSISQNRVIGLAFFQHVLSIC